MLKKAVIDLGTNTFHLLIVNMTGDDNFEEIYRKRVYVKLAEDGIDTIGESPMKRAFAAMNLFSNKLKEYECKSIKAYATAALRTASNGQEFIDTVKTDTGILIELIDGKKEADLIFTGVRHAVEFDNQFQLVMDIGGGSTEFIIGNKNGKVWAESFLAGVGILYKKFHKSEPISKSEREKIESYLNKILAPVFEAVKKYQPFVLTGSAGAFETMTDLIPCEKVNENFAIFETDFFPEIRDKIINSNLEERFQIEGMPEIRAEFITVAMILIDYVLKETDIQKIYYSAYALKEGMIFKETD